MIEKKKESEIRLKQIFYPDKLWISQESIKKCRKVPMNGKLGIHGYVYIVPCDEVD